MLGLRHVNCGEYVDQLVRLFRWAQQGVPLCRLQLVSGRATFSIAPFSLSAPLRRLAKE